MKNLFYLTSIIVLLFSCNKDDDGYYSFDTNFGLEIKNKMGKDLLDTGLVVDKIILSGTNSSGDSPTKGFMTPDVPPFDTFSLKKNGPSNVLHLTFDPIYSDSNLIIKWKNISKQDTLMAELYNKNNTVYIRRIFWNGSPAWTEDQKENRNSIKIVKDI